MLPKPPPLVLPQAGQKAPVNFICLWLQKLCQFLEMDAELVA